MLKKTIKYKNFDDEPVEDTFYFHLSEAEIVELETSHKGGLAASLQKIIDSEDLNGILQEFKNLIMLSYGKRSVDGKRFIKNAEILAEFKETGAYSALFMELVTNTDSSIEFVNGIIPANLAESIKEKMEQITTPSAAEVALVPPVEAVEPEVVSRSVMEAMSREDLQKLFERIRAGEVVLGE